MKYIYLILAVALFAGCKKVVLDVNEDRLYLNEKIADVTVSEGTVTWTVDISDVFKVANNNNALIARSVQSVQNPALLSAQIIGDNLVLQITIGQTGTTSVNIRAEYGSGVVYDSFDITVTPISASSAMNTAIQQFQNLDYASAEVMFKVVISKENLQLVSDAWMGLGFSQMRLDRAEDGYQSLQFSLNQNPANLDAQAGMSLLEFAYRRNYSEAIRIGQAVLQSAPAFVFRYDSSLDEKDVHLNIALSQFSMQDFDACLASVQVLDPTFNLSLADPDFQAKLAQKLEELILAYS
jgi:tetratricopeptide (TPR) repeat protein